jgi:hypothetical protein
LADEIEQAIIQGRQKEKKHLQELVAAGLLSDFVLSENTAHEEIIKMIKRAKYNKRYLQEVRDFHISNLL